MKNFNRFLFFSIIIGSFLSLNITEVVAQNKIILYITYKLPTNPDLVNDASSLVSECTNKHAVCMQSCQIGDGKADCQKRCEQAMRQCLLGINGIRYWLAVCKEGNCHSVSDIIPLTREEALDPRLNAVFNEISTAGYYSMTGTYASVSSGSCIFRRTSDDAEISFPGSPFIAQAIENHYGPNSFMKNALYLAIENGQDALMISLLSRGLDPNGTTDFYRPVAIAIQKERWDIVKDLIVKYKIDINIPIKMNGLTWTLLESAVSHDDFDIVRLLLDYGADINACGLCIGFPDTSPGSYPLTFAIGNKNIAMVKFLLSKGADIKNSDYLYNAVIWNDIEMIKYLIGQGADVNYYNIETPLTQASFQGNLAIVKILVQHGANINKINNFGETALDLAEKKSHTEVAAFLRSKGAKNNK